MRTACQPGHSGRRMQIRVGCEFSYQAEVATRAVIQVEPRLDGATRVRDERWVNVPLLAMARYVDGFGNICRWATLPVGVAEVADRFERLVELVVGRRTSCPPARRREARRRCPGRGLRTTTLDPWIPAWGSRGRRSVAARADAVECRFDAWRPLEDLAGFGHVRDAAASDSAGKFVGNSRPSHRA